jgi:glycosyltransferase involved in cell wall biosynthesis
MRDAEQSGETVKFGAGKTCPRVSIGLPVYNGEKFLRESIESVLGQDFGDFELLVSDNASSDSTWDICQQYAAADSRVRIHRQERNLGAIRNFQYVFMNSMAPFFMWHAHDDLLGPTFVGECYSLLSADSDCVLACSLNSLIRPDGSIVPADKDAFDFRSADPVTRFGQAFAGCARLNLPIYGLIRRDALAALSLDRRVHGLDFVFTMELVLKGTFTQSRRAMRYYRVKPAYSDPVVARRFTESSQYLHGEPSQVKLFGAFQMLAGIGKAVSTSGLPASQRWEMYLIVATSFRILWRWLWGDLGGAAAYFTRYRPRVYKTLHNLKRVLESGVK